MDDLTNSGVTGGESDTTALSTTDTSAVASQSDDLGLQTTDIATGGTEAPAWESIIESIPDNDDDLAQPTYPHVKGLQEQRQQLRSLKAAIKELQPLTAYRELGDINAIKPAVTLVDKLYSPLTDPRTGQLIVDPATQTPYVHTKPFLEYLDQQSPGMPEQLLVDLLDFEPTDEHGQKGEKLARQVLRHWGLDPNRINDYRNIDTQVATYSGAITSEELKDIPAEFHAAYRTLPPSIRNAWAAFDEADQLMMLRNEQDRLQRTERDKQREEQDKQREAYEQQQYAQLVRQEQNKYFQTVRRERFASIAERLSERIVFSTDPTTNAVMHGAVGTVIANLIDPELRFVSEGILTALGVKLDHTFDEALNTFNYNANQQVAFRMAGDMVQAERSTEAANAAATTLTTKLGVIALKVAKAMGGQQQAVAAAQGQTLNTATTSRQVAPIGTSPNGQQQGILPPGMRPGTPEAARWLADSTGFYRAN